MNTRSNRNITGNENINDTSVNAMRDYSDSKQYQMTSSDREFEDPSNIESIKSYNFKIDDSENDGFDGIDSASDNAVPVSS